MARKLRDEITAVFAEVRCPDCGIAKPIGEITPPDGGTEWLHFARLRCKNCGRFLRWLSWPTTDTEEKRNRRRSRKNLKPEADSYCEICLRSDSDLVKPDRLEVHHVVEKADNGNDDPDNLRTFCSACHAWVGWIRTYLTRRSERAE